MSGQILYDRWWKDQRLEFIGTVTAVYTKTATAFIDYGGWDEVTQLNLRWSGNTGITTDGKPWRWNLYTDYTDFVTTPKAALGFRRYLETGVGMEWEWTQKPLDWFGIRFLGIKAGYIVGDDVTGYSIGLTFR